MCHGDTYKLRKLESMKKMRITKTCNDERIYGMVLLTTYYYPFFEIPFGSVSMTLMFGRVKFSTLFTKLRDIGDWLLYLELNMKYRSTYLIRK